MHTGMRPIFCTISARHCLLLVHFTMGRESETAWLDQIITLPKKILLYHYLISTNPFFNADTSKISLTYLSLLLRQLCIFMVIIVLKQEYFEKRTLWSYRVNFVFLQFILKRLTFCSFFRLYHLVCSFIFPCFNLKTCHQITI